MIGQKTNLGSNIGTEIDIVSENFRSIANGSTMTLQIFVKHLPELGFGLSACFGEKLFKLISNSSNTINIDEYKNYFAIANSDLVNEKSEKLFNFFSEFKVQIFFSQFSTIVKKTWKMYDKLLGVSEEIKILDIKRFFAEIDKKNDEVIDSEEFLNAFLSGNKVLNWVSFFVFGNKSVRRFEGDLIRKRLIQIEEDLMDCWWILKNPLEIPAERFPVVAPEEFITITNGRNDWTPVDTFQISDYNGFKSCIIEQITRNEDLTGTVEKIRKIAISSPDFWLEFLSKNLGQCNDKAQVMVFFIYLGILKSSQIHTEEISKFCIPMICGEPCNRKSFLFTVHFPLIFADIRKIYQLAEHYCESFSVDGLIKQFVQSDFYLNQWTLSEGKSGCLFYVTNDKKFMLKTVKDSEFEYFSEFLKEYHEYLQANPDTLISKILGLYTIKSNIEGARIKHTFIVMNYVFTGQEELEIIFDLKGSTQNRKATKDPLSTQKTLFLKDSDFQHSSLFLQLPPTTIQKIASQLKADCNFLSHLQVIDYSLLFGISSQSALPLLTSYSHTYPSIDNSKLFFFGIIDILSVYRLKKRLENLFKSSLFGNNISCIPPDQYASRLYNFIVSVFPK